MIQTQIPIGDALAVSYFFANIIMYINSNSVNFTYFFTIRLKTDVNINNRIWSNSSRSLLYDELGWETLEVRRKIHKLVLFYKIVYALAPQYNYLVDLLGQCLQPQNSYPLRNQDNLTFQVPQSKTTSSMKIFLPSTIRLWNELPYNICSLSIISSFIHAIKICIVPKPGSTLNMVYERKL